MEVVKEEEKPDEVFGLLKAVAHPVRWSIVDVLNREGEVCVCDLQHKLEIEQAVISQQLKKLKSGGVVSGRKKGRYCHYKIVNSNVKELLLAVQKFKAYDE